MCICGCLHIFVYVICKYVCMGFIYVVMPVLLCRGVQACESCEFGRHGEDVLV